MARLTVEDCLVHIPNRFDLVLQATQRARHLIYSGEEPQVPRKNDKSTVVALREIAAGFDTNALCQKQADLETTSAE